MDKVQKSVIHLLNGDGVFYASLLMQMQRREAPDLPEGALAGVSVENGRIILHVDPPRLEKFSLDQCARIMEHECLPAGTFLTGVNKPIEEVKEGDLVLDSKGNMIPVLHAMKRPYKGKMYTIKTAMIPSFDLTYNHPLLVSEFKRKNHKRELSEPKWIRADELKSCTRESGHYLLVPKYEKRDFGETVSMASFVKVDNHCIKNVDLLLNEELAWVLGFYTAEGSYTEHKTGTVEVAWGTHAEKDKPHRKRVLSFLEKNGYSGREYVTNGKVTKLVTQSPILGRAFSSWCGKGASNKKIPDFILFNKDEKILRSYLAGYVAGDGCEWKGTNLPSTVSPTLAYQLQLAILNLGESAYVSLKKDNTSRLVKKALPLYTVGWRKETYHTIKSLDRYYALPIRELSHRAFEGDVYNIETKTNTYTLQNIVSHNCMHLVMEHISRKQGRDHLLWNVAGDLAVNSLIRGMDLGLIAGKTDPFKDFPSKKNAEYYYARVADKTKKGKVTLNPDGSVTVKNPDGSEATYRPTGDHKDWDKSDDGSADSLTKEVIKQAVAEAYSQAKKAGKLPGGIEDLIEELLGKEKIPWQRLLKQYIGNKVRAGKKYSWKRESKRFGDLQKGKIPTRMIKLGIAIDTSGSVSQEEFQEFMAEIYGIMNSYKTEITIVECDAKVQKVYQLKKYQKIDAKFKGRGGTDFRPVFEYFTEGKGRAKKPELLVFFTDLEGPFPKRETVRTVWVRTSQGYAETVPFGKLLIIPPKDGASRKRRW